MPLQRVNSQSAQKEKLAAANVVITNNGSYDDLGNKSVKHGRRLALTGNWFTTQVLSKPVADRSRSSAESRATAQKIADLITRLSKGKHTMTKDEAMEAFGDKAFLLLQMDNDLVGIAGWQVENLVARTTDLFLDPKVAADKALPLMHP